MESFLRKVLYTRTSCEDHKSKMGGKTAHELLHRGNTEYQIWDGRRGCGRGSKALRSYNSTVLSFEN